MCEVGLLSEQEEGCAISLQELTPGAYGISAPVLDWEGWAIASIGISGPLERLTEERAEFLKALVRRVAGDISLRLRQ